MDAPPHVTGLWRWLQAIETEEMGEIAFSDLLGLSMPSPFGPAEAVQNRTGDFVVV
jgi:hypothetical protein